MPFFTPAVTTESDAWFTFLDQQCAQLRLSALDLTDEQARSTPTASDLSIAGILAHAAQVVYSWLQHVRHPDATVTEDAYLEYNRELGLDGAFDGATRPEMSIAEILNSYDRAVAEIAAARGDVEARALDLGTAARMPEVSWMPDFAMNVRWVLAHLCTAIARHAGHADIIRESIDGAISYQLNAQADGEPWPPEEWS